KIVSAVQDDFAGRNKGWSAYFNSGVICIDVHSWRAAGIGSTALALVLNDGMSDQQALNTVLEAQWTPLDPRWNVMTHCYAPNTRWAYAPAACRSVAIRHFTMRKPWLTAGRGMGATRFHTAAAELREVNSSAWDMLRAAAVR